MYFKLGCLVILFLCLAKCPSTQASVFNPECSLPPPETTFVASPNTRGTFSILWNCVSIIILCTWNIQHLNIPARRPNLDRHGRKYRWLRTMLWDILDIRISLWWFVLTILAPEYIMGRALSERLAATTSLETLRSRFGDEMELVHAYIMNMGGYYLDFSDIGFSGIKITRTIPSESSQISSKAVDYSGIHFSAGYVNENLKSQLKTQSLGPSQKETINISIDSDKLKTTSPPPTITKKPPSKSTTLVNSNVSINSPELPGSRIALKNPSQRIPSQETLLVSIEHLSSFQILNLKRFSHKKWALTALQLLSAKGFRLYTTLPEVPAQDLKSLSKRDSFTTALALVNIGWLMVELVVRHQQNLMSSQLEIATFALAVCSILTYVISWNHPQGVSLRYKITAIKQPTPDEVVLLATFGPGYLWTWHRLSSMEDKDLDLMPIPNDASHAVDARNLFSGFENTIVGRTLIEWLRHNHPAVASVIAGSALGGTLFGALHCLAWRFSFPTLLELLLWRICAITTTVIPLLSVYFNLQWSYYNGWAQNGKRSLSQKLHGPILVGFFGVPYIIARLFLMVETFRTLFFLPPEAFVSTWPGAFLIWG